MTRDRDGVAIHHGDCLDVLSTVEPVDAVITDPPYGLSFMGKDWDHGVPGAAWSLVLGAMKPGAHLLAFGSTRTHHRLMCAIEDAGFEIRDCVMWVYASGFPKSLDVSKAIDKAARVEREKILVPTKAGNHPEQAGDIALGATGMTDISKPVTDAAKQWDGWGTALKPAWEPIIVARKPLEGTVAKNVLKHGTGGLNIDDCRVGSDPGRWPANLIHDGSEEVLEPFPKSKDGTAVGGKGKASSIYGTKCDRSGGSDQGYGGAGSAARFFYCAKASGTDRGNETLAALPLFDISEETFSNEHPTVKPIALMRYLCRLVTPPGGVILDPFAGSGSTLIAAKAEGFKAVGIELEKQYCEIAVRRLDELKL